MITAVAFNFSMDGKMSMRWFKHSKMGTSYFSAAHLGWSDDEIFQQIIYTNGESEPFFDELSSMTSETSLVRHVTAEFTHGC